MADEPEIDPTLERIKQLIGGAITSDGKPFKDVLNEMTEEELQNRLKALSPPPEE